MASSNKKQKPDNTTNLFFALIFLALIIGGGAAFYIQKQHIQAKQLGAAELKQRKEEKAAIQVLFDNYLNDFKADLSAKAKIYKESRSVLKDIKSPYNFETPEYAKENYDLFKNSVAPSLRGQADGIMEIFQNYDKKIKEDLGNSEDATQEVFFEKWTEMAHEQLDKYIDFFVKEDELIQAYDDLITFYYTHSNRYTVDVEKNEFFFGREEDGRKAAELLKRIDSY